MGFARAWRSLSHAGSSPRWRSLKPTEPHQRLPQLTGEEGDGGVMANRSNPELGRTRQALYRPELTLTRQKGCVGAESRVADVVVGIWGTTMCALAIRDDISPEELRRQARRERDGRVSARLIAIANALEGMDRASAARLAGMDRQTLRDWVHRYNAEGIAGLCNRPAPGRRPKLSEGQMAALKAVVLAGPD